MKIIGLCIILLAFTTANAATLKDKNAAKALASSVMNKVAQGKTLEGVDLVKDYLIVPLPEFETLKNQISMQTPMIEQRFGKTIKVELASVEEVGESLMLVIYIQKFEKHLLRWKFYFYKPNDEWVLNTFNFVAILTSSTFLDSSIWITTTNSSYILP